MDDYDRELPFMARLESLGLGGETPDAKVHARTTKIGRLEAVGWKILPIPKFWAEGEFTRNSRTGKGNPACVDFSHPHEWLVIPPDEEMKAFKVVGRVCAIREAWALAGIAAE